MRTYRELFATPEYTPYFLSYAAQVAGGTLSGLAFSVLIWDATASPLLSALALFAPSLVHAVGALTLLSGSDRLPPRLVITVLCVLKAAGSAVQAIPGLPVWASFAVLLGVGAAGSLGDGVAMGLQTQILPASGFVLGRAVLNMAAGVLQIAGYALGGVLLLVLSPRWALLVAAALYGCGALLARFGLRARPPRASGRPSVAETWRDNARLWASKDRRWVFLALWVPNGLVVGCESLYVAYSPRHAALLFAAGAAGMLAGDTLTGRFVPAAWRERLAPGLRLLLAAPFLAFALRPPLAVAVLAVLVATVGYAASLLLQERLIALTPPESSGHALGLAFAGMMTMQGVGAAVAGWVAQLTSPATAMAVLAAASMAVTLALAPGLRGAPTATPSASTQG